MGLEIVKGQSKPKKVPKNPTTGRNAQVPTDPTTYGTRDDAEARWQKIKAKGNGVTGGTGIVLGKLPDGSYFLVGVDLDSCRDPNTGAIPEWAQEIITRFNTYAEVSPSGTGVKLFFLMGRTTSQSSST